MTMASIAQLIIGVVDLAAALLFMYGLKRMSSPVTAPSGIFVAGIGMLVAVLASFLYVFDVGAAARPHLMINVGLGVVALIIRWRLCLVGRQESCDDGHAANGRAL